MSFYLGSSTLVSALTPENDTPRIRTWLRGHVREGLFISDWVVAEFTSALSVKLRNGSLRLEDRTVARANFERLRRQLVRTLPVNRGQFEVAAQFADRHEVPIRAGDALHLAIAAEHRLTLCTLDRQQADAGPALGVATLRL